MQGDTVIKYCWGYVRVSTDKQGKDGTSLDKQEQDIRDWAKKRNCKVLGIQIDEGVSGTLGYEDRPRLKYVLGKLKKGDAFVTVALSRLGRKFTDQVNVMQKIRDTGAIFISVNENYDTSTYVGVLQTQIMSSIAEMQARQISDYAKETAIQFKKTGRHYGSVPYGWEKISDAAGSGLQEVEVEQKIIKLIKQRRAEKDDKGIEISFYKIAQELNELKIPSPKSDKRSKESKPSKWSGKAVKMICERSQVNVKGREGMPQISIDKKGKARGYVRCYKNEKEPHFQAEFQKIFIQRALKEQNFELVSLYEDLDVDETTETFEPNFKKLLEELEEGEKIIFLDLNRISHTIVGGLQFLDVVAKKASTIVTAGKVWEIDQNAFQEIQMQFSVIEFAFKKELR